MKTAEQQLQRMEALVRKMAKTDIDRYAMTNPESLIYAKASIFLEARTIVSELPVPVDKDVLVAKELAATVSDYIGSHISADVYRNESRWDRGEPVKAIVEALRRAREGGVK